MSTTDASENLATLSADWLRDEVRGRVIAAGDPDYDENRALFPGGFDPQPALIARVLDATDVARVVSLARATGVGLAVRGGGHSAAGHGSVDGGIVIDMRDMKAIEIDAEERTAWAEAGITAGEYTARAAEHGLATGFGDAGSVGIAGITLGGGVGFLSRKLGLTIDSLLAAEIVTADGRILHVDDESHPDLFWAIRGGGGNFGVVTRLKLRLHEVDRVVGGMLFLPAEPEVVERVIAEADAAPEELSAIVNVMKAPPAPFVPEEVRGKPVVLAMIAYAGPEDEGERAVARFRSIAEPVADMLRPMSYAELFPDLGDDYHPAAVIRTRFADRIDAAAARTIVDQISAEGVMGAVQLRVLGGAIARVAGDATAYAHRERAILVNTVAMYVAPDGKQSAEAFVEGVTAELGLPPGAYANFLSDEGEARVREAYPGATWERLARVKAQYDPDNLFRRNHNVAPAAAGG